MLEWDGGAQWFEGCWGVSHICSLVGYVQQTESEGPNAGAGSAPARTGVEGRGWNRQGCGLWCEGRSERAEGELWIMTGFSGPLRWETVEDFEQRSLAT